MNVLVKTCITYTDLCSSLFLGAFVK